MEPQSQGYLTYPNIDVTYYFSHIGSYLSDHFPIFYDMVRSFIGILIGISIPISIFLILAIIILVEGLKSLRKKEEAIYSAKIEPAYTDAAADQELGKRWKTIVEHADSGSQNDWKQAIIEADVLLDNLVTKLGYQGESLGEKLKRTTTGDFKSRDAAWEAHMVRNRIAHDGSAYDINQIEAKRVISLYRQVFDEFYHISG